MNNDSILRKQRHMKCKLRVGWHLAALLGRSGGRVRSLEHTIEFAGVFAYCTPCPGTGRESSFWWNKSIRSRNICCPIAACNRSYAELERVGSKRCTKLHDSSQQQGRVVSPCVCTALLVQLGAQHRYMDNIILQKL